jgi:hypothetical protein
MLRPSKAPPGRPTTIGGRLEPFTALAFTLGSLPWLPSPAYNTRRPAVNSAVTTTFIMTNACTATTQIQPTNGALCHVLTLTCILLAGTTNHNGAHTTWTPDNSGRIYSAMRGSNQGTGCCRAASSSASCVLHDPFLSLGNAERDKDLLFHDQDGARLRCNRWGTGTGGLPNEVPNLVVPPCLTSASSRHVPRATT